jgi:hypothetical protein
VKEKFDGEMGTERSLNTSCRFFAEQARPRTRKLLAIAGDCDARARKEMDEQDEQDEQDERGDSYATICEISRQALKTLDTHFTMRLRRRRSRSEVYERNDTSILWMLQRVIAVLLLTLLLFREHVGVGILRGGVVRALENM